MPAVQPYKRAAAFISFHYAWDCAVMSRILDTHRSVIGYEVRPYCRPFEFGCSHVLDVSYTIEDGKVIVRIHLIPVVEQYLRERDRRSPVLFRMR
jgi:hypothetical protein